MVYTATSLKNIAVNFQPFSIIQFCTNKFGYQSSFEITISVMCLYHHNHSMYPD